MSIVKIASFEYEIFVVLSITQSIYNIRSLRQVRVNNVLFVVPYLAKKRIIGIVEQISKIYQFLNKNNYNANAFI